ncbi:MAG TPA: ATP-binding protein [Solirubrobacteraceae bacterium]|nr:ATP-binding protein [Solirubrobacteraceae bacterium]
MRTAEQATTPRGRASECATLDALLEDVPRGEGRSLVLRGEAGIVKTALLEYVIESASDMTVVRAVGVESEMELAYASLQRARRYSIGWTGSRLPSRRRCASCSG